MKFYHRLGNAYVKVSYLAYLEELQKIKVFLSKTVFCNIYNPD